MLEYSDTMNDSLKKVQLSGEQHLEPSRSTKPGSSFGIFQLSKWKIPPPASFTMSNPDAHSFSTVETALVALCV
jgi:hypothetical protein